MYHLYILKGSCSSFALIFLYHFWKNNIVGSEYMDGWMDEILQVLSR